MNSRKTLRALRAACLLAVAVLSTAAASPAATPRWVEVTPFGGAILSLAQAPSAPQTLYAVDLNGRVFRSLDGGATWRPRGKAPGDYLIDDLIADPHDARTVYGRTGFPQLFRSRDAGVTWSAIDPVPDLLAVFGLAVDKNHPGVLFAATRLGLYRSDDRGDSWHLAGLEGLLAGAVAIDPRQTDTIFASVHGDDSGATATFWKSTDRGATWTSTPVPEGFITAPLRFAFDPARPEVLYAFTTRDFSGAVFRSADGGASWVLLPAAAGVRDLAVLPDGTLLAATDFGLARSTDQGETWTPPLPAYPAAPPREPLLRLLVPSTPGVVFAAGGSGVWKSVDNGASWALSNQGIVAQGTTAVTVAPVGPPAVFTVAWSGLFRSVDQGATWTRLHSAFDEPQPFAITAFDPRRPRTIYGIGFDGQADYPVVSRNSGRQWIELEIPFSCDGGDSVCGVGVPVVALDPHDPDTLIAGGSYFFHFQGGGSFLLRSDDGGQTWDELTTVPGIQALAIDPRRRGTYHALSCEGLFRSRDAGTTWQKTGSGLPANLCPSTGGLPVLAIDPRDPRRLYVGAVSQGVFASSDGGATFRAMNRGLQNAQVVTLQVDPTDSARIYAGAALRGVFQWNAEQGRWTPLNKGLPLANFAGAIALDPRNPSILYAAQPSTGLFRLDLDDTAP